MCPLTTQAFYVEPVHVFETLPFVTLSNVANGQQLAWTLYTTEVGSMSIWSPQVPVVDTLTARHTPYQNFIMFEDGSVAIIVPTGVNMAPALVTVALQTGTLLPNGGASLNVRLVMYVAQPSSSPNITLADPLMQVLSPYSADGQTSCGTYSRATDGVFPATTGYACLNAGCPILTSAQLPSALLASTTGAANSWVAYAVTLACTYAIAPGPMLSATLSIPYELWMNGTYITDQASPPFAQIQVSGVPLVAATSATPLLPVASSVIQLNESTLVSTSTLSDIAYANQIGGRATEELDDEDLQRELELLAAETLGTSESLQPPIPVSSPSTTALRAPAPPAAAAATKPPQQHIAADLTRAYASVGVAVDSSTSAL